MPFGPYEDFGSCVADQKRKGHDDDAARRICGALRRDLESDRERNKTLQQLLIVEAAALASLYDASRQADAEPAAFAAAFGARRRARSLARSRLRVETPRLHTALELDGEQDHAADVEGAQKTAQLIAEALASGGTEEQVALAVWRKIRTAACWDVFKAFNAEQRAALEAFAQHGKRHHRTGRFVKKVSKVWVATLDDKTCEYCEEMDGEEVAGDEEFDVAEVAGDNPFDSDEPPLHSSCRCVLAIDDSGAGDSDDEDDEE